MPILLPFSNDVPGLPLLSPDITKDGLARPLSISMPRIAVHHICGHTDHVANLEAGIAGLAKVDNGVGPQPVPDCPLEHGMLHPLLVEDLPELVRFERPSVLLEEERPRPRSQVAISTSSSGKIGHHG